MEAKLESPSKDADKTRKLVNVTVVSISEESGEQVEEGNEIPRGKTEVTDLKEELGIPAELALWVIDNQGRRTRLADHETYNVKKDDRFVVIRPGGVS
jgi:hypothetical protein